MKARSGLNVFLWVRVALFVLIIGVASLLVANAFHVVERVDRVSHQRDVAALQSGLFLLGEVTSAEQSGVTVWDEAYEKVVIQRDSVWMTEHLGGNVYDSREERILVLDGQGEVIYSSRNSDAGTRDGAVGAGSVIIERVRSLYAQALYRAGDQWRVHMERPGAMVPGLYAHDVAVVDGLPVIYSASAFLPDLRHDLLTVTPPTVLVHIRYLKGNTLIDLAATSRLEDIQLRFVTSDAEDSQPGNHRIVDREGNVVVTAVWKREAPGHAVMQAMWPTVLVTVLVIAVSTMGGSTLLRRIMEGLARREEAAVRASRYDAGTGLANRGWFHACFAEAMAECNGDREGDSLGVVLIDLDYFKMVNDTLGHAAGDAVIKAAADRLNELDDDTVVAARIGGDEFAIITHPLSGAEGLTGFCRRLHKALLAPVRYGGHEIPLSASIGAALYPGNGRDADTVLLAADLALYRAKREGRGRYRIFDEALDGRPGDVDDEAGEPPVATGHERRRGSV